MPTRVALKIDVDTFRGTKDGVRAMLEDLARVKVRASFYVSVGPDRSGLAVLRVFRKRGFLAKMLRTNAARMYGWRTMLYGTLLPAPLIGRRCEAELRAIRDAGHEVALHAWDHVLWQDRLGSLTAQDARAQVARGVEEFARIFGAPPRAFAAPAWTATDDALLALDDLGLEYVSVSRGLDAPFFPEVRGRALRALEIPTTQPTLDEALGRDCATAEDFVERLVSSYRPDATEVVTLHAEAEGMAYRSVLQDLLDLHAAQGIETVTLAEVAREARARGSLVVRPLVHEEIPGRAGPVLVPGRAPAAAAQ